MAVTRYVLAAALAASMSAVNQAVIEAPAAEWRNGETKRRQDRAPRSKASHKQNARKGKKRGK